MNLKNLYLDILGQRWIYSIKYSKSPNCPLSLSLSLIGSGSSSQVTVLKTTEQTHKKCNSRKGWQVCSSCWMCSRRTFSEVLCHLNSHVFRWSRHSGLIVYLAVGPGTSLTFHYVWPTSLTSQFIISCLCCLHWNLGCCLYKPFTWLWFVYNFTRLSLQPTI